MKARKETEAEEDSDKPGRRKRRERKQLCITR